MLGLGDKVRRDQFRVGAFVGDHHRLRGAVDGVDANVAKHLLLRDRDEQAARAADLIDSWERFRAVGEGRDALGAAAFEYAIDAGNVRRDEFHRRDGPVGEDGARHVQLIDARDAGRHGAHDYRARERRARSGDIEPDALDGARNLAEAILVEIERRAAQLEFVVTAHALGREFEGIDQFATHRVVGRPDLFWRNPKLLRLGAVDPPIVVADSVVAVLAHVADDAPDHFVGAELGPEGAENRLTDVHGEFVIFERAPAEERAAAFFGVANYPHSRYLAIALVAAAVARWT